MDFQVLFFRVKGYFRGVFLVMWSYRAGDMKEMFLPAW